MADERRKQLDLETLAFLKTRPQTRCVIDTIAMMERRMGLTAKTDTDDAFANGNENVKVNEEIVNDNVVETARAQMESEVDENTEKTDEDIVNEIDSENDEEVIEVFGTPEPEDIDDDDEVVLIVVKTQSADGSGSECNPIDVDTPYAEVPISVLSTIVQPPKMIGKRKRDIDDYVPVGRVAKKAREGDVKLKRDTIDVPTPQIENSKMAVFANASKAIMAAYMKKGDQATSAKQAIKRKRDVADVDIPVEKTSKKARKDYIEFNPFANEMSYEKLSFGELTNKINAPTVEAFRATSKAVIDSYMKQRKEAAGVNKAVKRKRATEDVDITAGKILKKARHDGSQDDPTDLDVSEPQNTSKTDDIPSTKIVLKNKVMPAGAKKFGFIPRPMKNIMAASKKVPGSKKKSRAADIIALRKPKVGGLRDLPAEIRLKIFGYYMDNTWNGRSPPLIRACRGDRVLYPELIETFYRSDNTFHLNSRNGWSFCSMSQKAIESIRKLKIEIKDYHPPPLRHPHRSWTQIPKPKKITKLWAKAINVEELIIESRLGGEQYCRAKGVVPAVVRIFKQYLVHAQKLRSLEIDFRFAEMNRSVLPDFDTRTAPIIDRLLGVEGQENKVERLRRYRRTKVYSVVWSWEMAQERKEPGSKVTPEVKYFKKVTRQRLRNDGRDE